ncbi:MAG TPA: hypothetical protein VMB47_01525, partial [Candidatus Aquilonibacter sp.]|nr:hypothetical protein [Candidatus Aquilonibacter sp.]
TLTSCGKSERLSVLESSKDSALTFRLASRNDTQAGVGRGSERGGIFAGFFQTLPASAGVPALAGKAQ